MNLRTGKGPRDPTSHLTNEEVDTERRQVICRRSLAPEVAEPQQKLGSPDSQGHGATYKRVALEELKAK